MQTPPPISNAPQPRRKISPILIVVAFAIVLGGGFLAQKITGGGDTSADGGSKSSLLSSATAALAGKPSEDDGKNVVLSKINAQSQGRIGLVSFKKTNGQDREVQGVKVYLMSFEANITFTEDCMWGEVHGSQWRGKFLTEPGIPRGVMASFDNMDKRPGKRGSQTLVKGTVIFQKTEQGWQGGISQEGDGTVADVPGESGAQSSNVPADPNARNECVNHLRQIEGAKEQWALEEKKNAGDSVDEAGVNRYISDGIPKCPSGGVYSYGAVGKSPTCSSPGHRLPN